MTASVPRPRCRRCPSVVYFIFSLLPVDCRLRCSEVCRSWRCALWEPTAWTRLHLTAAGGVRMPARHFSRLPFDNQDALLALTAARAAGSVRSLHVSLTHVTHAALLATAAINAGALRELHASADDASAEVACATVDQAEALLTAAPLLRVLATDLCCDDAAAAVLAVRRALRNEAPFAPLSVRQLHARLSTEPDVVVFVEDVTAHASLRALSLEDAWLDAPAVLDGVVDAVLARSSLERLHFCNCRLSPASAPALTRLLCSEALTTLSCKRMALLDAPSAAVLAAAFHASTTLTSLTLHTAGVFADVAVGAELLRALTGHASVRALCLRGNRVAAEHGAAVGASLAALLAANAPALTELDVSQCDLHAAGLRPLFEALPANSPGSTIVRSGQP
jgi:hypothetical protein